MNSQYDALGEAGLLFFGKVSASISHEIKNVLAIINENVGLLEDFAFAAQNGKAIDPDRLSRVCQQFNKQILRADHILRNMSRFAHSVDRFESPVDLHDVAVLVANLAGRLAAMRKLTIAVDPPPSPIIVNTNPFLVQNLIWLCLELALTLTTAGGTLRLTAEKKNDRSSLRIDGLDGLTRDSAENLPAGLAGMFAAIGAECFADAEKKNITIFLT